MQFDTQMNGEAHANQGKQGGRMSIWTTMWRGENKAKWCN